jgi:hypothetical protein
MERYEYDYATPTQQRRVTRNSTELRYGVVLRVNVASVDPAEVAYTVDHICLL